MNPGKDSKPRVPAATPNKEAVSARMFEIVCVARIVSLELQC